MQTSSSIRRTGDILSSIRSSLRYGLARRFWNMDVGERSCLSLKSCLRIWPRFRREHANDSQTIVDTDWTVIGWSGGAVFLWMDSQTPTSRSASTLITLSLATVKVKVKTNYLIRPSQGHDRNSTFHPALQSPLSNPHSSFFSFPSTWSSLWRSWS